MRARMHVFPICTGAPNTCLRFLPGTKCYLEVNRRVCVKAPQPATQLCEVYSAAVVFVDKFKKFLNLLAQRRLGVYLAEFMEQRVEGADGALRQECDSLFGIF